MACLGFSLFSYSVLKISSFRVATSGKQHNTIERMPFQPMNLNSVVVDVDVVVVLIRYIIDCFISIENNLTVLAKVVRFNKKLVFLLMVS